MASIVRTFVFSSSFPSDNQTWSGGGGNMCLPILVDSGGRGIPITNRVLQRTELTRLLPCLLRIAGKNFLSAMPEVRFSENMNEEPTAEERGHQRHSSLGVPFGRGLSLGEYQSACKHSSPNPPLAIHVGWEEDYDQSARTELEAGLRGISRLLQENNAISEITGTSGGKTEGSTWKKYHLAALVGLFFSGHISIMGTWSLISNHQAKHFLEPGRAANA